MKVKITLKGMDALMKEIGRQKSKTALIKQEVLASALDIKTQAVDNLRALGAWDKGGAGLAGSIIVETTPNGLSAEVGSPLPYAPYVEFGTRAHFPPMEALEDWARKHKVPVFLVARAIAKRGLPARPYLNPAFFSIEGEFFDRLKKIMEK